MHPLYGDSRSQHVSFLVASSFPIAKGYSFISDNNNFVTQQPPRNDYGCRAYGELSHFVYCLLQKIKASGSLPVVERWRVTCSQTICPSQQSRRSNFWWGPASMQRWKKWRAITSRESSEAVPVVFLRSSPALFCQLLPRVPSWVRASIVFARRSLSEVLTIPPSFSLDNSWTAWLRLGGRKGQTLKLARLSFNPLLMTNAN